MNALRLLFIFCFSIFLFTSCLKDDCEQEVTYDRYIPIKVHKTDFRSKPLTYSAPRALEHPGKIYWYEGLLFIVEEDQGIHIFNNENPENPVAVSFMEISGAEDLVVRNDYLYANQNQDLIAIDLSDPLAGEIVARIEDFVDLPRFGTDSLIIGYNVVEVTEMQNCNSGGGVFLDGPFAEAVGNFDNNSTSAGSGGTAPSTNGLGGSMARFRLAGSYLYGVDESRLKVVDLQNAVAPQWVNTVDIGWGIETIFPHEDKLFIGSNSGMFIYNNANPTEPTFMYEFQHARACDPVFVKDDFAYVTLRDGNLCQGFINQMDLIDISNLLKPKLVESFPMDNPHGLTIRDNNLYLCEGKYGLKVFDITDPTVLDEHLLNTQSDRHAFDAISVPTERPVIMVIGADGFYQYDVSTPSEPVLISTIPVQWGIF